MSIPNRKIFRAVPVKRWGGGSDLSIFTGSHGLPECIAIAVVVLLHCWKRQMLLSIAGGTVSYMLLVQLVF